MDFHRSTMEMKNLKSMENHPRCAILPSPEKLDESISSPGLDQTNTLGDFVRIREWLKRSGLLNIEFHYPCIGQNAAETNWENLEDTQYYPFVQFAFTTAFDPMRNTSSPYLEELVFWYYAGHGLGKVAAAQLSYSSTPCLDRVKINPEYHTAANQFVKKFEGRKVKGGELCLHKVGFCDLYGLLKPWIAAVKAESRNAKGCSKKNKHLVIILDSCYSGIIAEELEKFEKYMEKKESKFFRENSVTIQAACGPDEGTLGGYFTPCFVYLNDRVNAKSLSKLKCLWNGMKAEERNWYKKLPSPSPMVVSTLSQFKQPQDVTLELTVQNFQFTLFRDPGFFKFCFISINKNLREMKRSTDLHRYLSGKKEQQEKQRSAWQNRYLEHIKSFSFPPVVADN